MIFARIVKRRNKNENISYVMAEGWPDLLADLGSVTSDADDIFIKRISERDYVRGRQGKI